MQTKQLSEHALCAKEIRKQLKRAYPEIKFSVTSDSYSGGNGVNVSYVNGPCIDDVDAIISCYQYGHFNGMEDIYEYSNTDKGIPQVKFVSASRNISKDKYLELGAAIIAKYGLSIPNPKSQQDMQTSYPELEANLRAGCWNLYTTVHRQYYKEYIT